MLARITGVLDRIDGGAATIAVPIGAGVLAYEVLVSPALAESLAPSVGGAVTLHTIEYFESLTQGASFTPRLLGFATPSDKRFFELLIKVKGLGPRRALRALAEPTPTIAAAVFARDVKALQRLPEIGKKLAETIIADLHEKIGPFVDGLPGAPAVAIRPGAARAALDSAPAPLPAAAAKALAALVRLGETRAEAERLVRLAVEQAPEARSPDAMLTAALSVRGV
jgi:Holliday junction DNA helicase RuvA